jgi:hypothetical protein
MAKKRAGWERMIYRDAAGNTAATLITPNVVDIGMSHVPEFVENTTRGAGTAAPKRSEQLVALNKVPGPLVMTYYDGDAHMAALLVAANAVTEVAIKIIRYNGGETEFDGDVLLEFDAPGGLKEGQNVTFTMHPNDDLRSWT